ncbi:MAG: hypothetical protein V1493_00160 [Candidatus Diapherotrites archaeon]
MKKAIAGILFGAITGILDSIPMVFQNLSLDAILSAFSLWVVSGFLVATSSLKIHWAAKGLLVSFLVLLPAAILIGWKEPVSLVPIAIMTLVLGSLLGYAIERFGK